MRVIKRDGEYEAVSFNKVLQRIRKASKGLTINPDVLAQQVLSQIYDGVKTSEIDELTGQLAASLSTNHPDWGTLASNIVVSNHQKKTSASFSQVMIELSNQPKGSYISEEILALCRNPDLAARIDAEIDYSRDYLFDYFGFKTLEKAYLLRDAKRLIKERPQHVWMRVALALWASNLDLAFETYHALSTKKFTHATPTLFNSGTPRQQLSSCFLLSMKDDSIAGIYETLKDCATISQNAGGIGLHIHKIRAKGSIIRGTNGTSNGIVPMLRNYNATARYVDQCFTPDTLVYTTGGAKPIEEIGVTDRVLSSKGTYEKVLLPVRHQYAGPMLEIQVKGSIVPVRTTPEHQIMALTGQEIGLNFRTIENRLEKGYAVMDFHDARDLQVGDFLVFPIPTYEADIHQLTEDDCRMYGILLGDGYISGSSAGVRLSTVTKVETADFVRSYLGARGIHITEAFDDSPNSVKLIWSSTHVGFKFTRAQLYNDKMKQVDPAFLHLPKPKIVKVLQGLIETDGCVGEKEITVEVTSDSIIEAIRYMLLRLGGLSSGYTRNRVGNVSSYKNITTRLPTTVIRIPRIPEILELFDAPASRCFTFMRYGNNLLSRIEKIDETFYDGIVHDFEIDGPHDYTVSHLGLVHNGGGKRNGSFAIYLEPWHADIEDFLKLKLNTGMEEDRARDLFYALWIPDLFMKRVEANMDWTVFCPDEAPGLDDVWGPAFEDLYHKYEAEGRGRKKINAQKLWFQILDAQIETGTPYLLYKDPCNAKSNQQNLGTIKSSNLCVAPETYVLTDQGQFLIHELEGMQVNVWNGDKWSETTVHKTGSQQRLLTVSLSNGADIHCTPYHKFLVRDGYTDKGSVKDATRIDASELKEGMKLAKCDLGLVEGNPEEDIPHPYTHGFFCGDGTVNIGASKKPIKICCLYGEKKKLIDKLAIKSTSGAEDAAGRINTTLDQSIPEKFYVPMNASLKCRLQWLAGLLDADGTVSVNGDNESLQLASIEYEFLDRVRLMVQTLGIQSKITKLYDARQTMLPDGKGGRKMFDCKPIWRILISSSGLYRLKNLGLLCHRLMFEGKKPQRNAEQFVTVVSVADYGRIDDTYCFNEPENHAGIFNGVLTGNCTEIIEYSSKDETAVCNLASISLPSCVVHGASGYTFDFDILRKTVGIATRNLNRVIDINFYPTPETERSNMRHRPVGLGIQGLADVFALLKYDWESPEAAELNQLIFEYMYFEAVSQSMELAKKEGPYSTFAGSPASQGKLQPDLWNVTPMTEKRGTLDWTSLRSAVVAHGLRNSLLVAPMPTASTSQILGNNECFEPFTTNIYSRRTLAGEFTIVNKYLMTELREAGLWTDFLKQEIVARNGSVQGIASIPAEMQARYKTTWEIKQRTLIDMAAARGAFIDQSQSLNLFVADPTYSKLTSMHFYAWKAGLKTGCYYLRSKAPVVAQQFTVDPRLLTAISSGGKVAEIVSDSEDDDDSEDEKEKEKEKSPQGMTAEARKQLLERLAAEADAEGCLSCGS